jgi:hypothetical protein
MTRKRKPLAGRDGSRGRLGRAGSAGVATRLIRSSGSEPASGGAHCCCCLGNGSTWRRPPAPDAMRANYSRRGSYRWHPETERPRAHADTVQSLVGAEVRPPEILPVPVHTQPCIYGMTDSFFKTQQILIHVSIYLYKYIYIYVYLFL